MEFFWEHKSFDSLEVDGVSRPHASFPGDQYMEVVATVLRWDFHPGQDEKTAIVYLRQEYAPPTLEDAIHGAGDKLLAIKLVEAAEEALKLQYYNFGLTFEHNGQPSANPSSGFERVFGEDFSVIVVYGRKLRFTNMMVDPSLSFGSRSTLFTSSDFLKHLYCAVVELMQKHPQGIGIAKFLTCRQPTADRF
ncbi:hypothetical protein T439DRAFT_73954 [Meredithblackwellia eburnea MCA 4105]